jgi:hypothetical protein
MGVALNSDQDNGIGMKAKAPLLNLPLDLGHNNVPAGGAPRRARAARRVRPFIVQTLGLRLRDSRANGS